MSTAELPEGQYRAQAGGPEWRGVVENRWEMLGVAVRLGRIWDNRVEYVVGIDAQSGVIVQRAEPNTYEPGASLLIPEALAKTLLDVLSQHFGGTSDTRTLRKDYDAERARVDKLMEKLTSPVFVVGNEVMGR